MKKQQLFWFFQCVFLVFGQEEEFCEADKCKDFSKSKFSILNIEMKIIFIIALCKT